MSAAVQSRYRRWKKYKSHERTDQFFLSDEHDTAKKNQSEQNEQLAEHSYTSNDLSTENQ